MKKTTPLEKITGNVITQGGLTALAAMVGSPLTALLPVLTDTLAAGRHTRRVEEAIEEVERTLAMHQHKLNELTDSQYKLINEIVLAVFQNTEDEKNEYLNRAVISGLEHSEISHTIAAQIARALRDMTAGELKFVVKHSGKEIMIGPVTGDINPAATLVIDRNSDEMIYVSGLMGLGVINPAGSTMDDGGRYVFAKFCTTLKNFITPYASK